MQTKKHCIGVVPPGDVTDKTKQYEYNIYRIRPRAKGKDRKTEAQQAPSRQPHQFVVRVAWYRQVLPT